MMAHVAAEIINNVLSNLLISCQPPSLTSNGTMEQQCSSLNPPITQPPIGSIQPKNPSLHSSPENKKILPEERSCLIGSGVGYVKLIWVDRACKRCNFWEPVFPNKRCGKCEKGRCAICGALTPEIFCAAHKKWKSSL